MRRKPVGAWLAREEALTSNIDIDRPDAFAGKPRSHRYKVCLLPTMTEY